MPTPTRQYRQPRDRRQADIALRPQYPVIPWTLVYVDGYHVELIVDPGQAALIANGVLPLQCTTTGFFPTAQTVAGLTVHLEFSNVFPPGASFQLAPFRPEIRNRWGGYLAAQEWSFAPVPTPWGSVFDSVLGPASFSITPTGGTDPFAVYQVPLIENVTSLGVAVFVQWTAPYFEIQMDAPINSGDHIQLSVDTDDIRDWLGAPMQAWAVDIP